jgi:arylsulfatase A
MLLTVRHPIRVGTGPEVGGELALEETTIAEGFKANGHRTGVFGKWHNGEDPDTPEFQAAFQEAFKSMPNRKHTGGHGANAHGFDEAGVYYGGGADYFNRRTVPGRGPVSWWHNREFRPNDEGYTDDLVTQRAIEFIRESKDRPFFCYIPFHIAHAPLQAKENDLAAVDPQMAAKLPTASGKTTDENKQLAGMIVKGGKGTMTEAGSRVPLLARWPETIKPGVREQLFCLADVLPTIRRSSETKAQPIARFLRRTTGE